MWYFPILKPYEDHVPVKEDLSDLEEKIQWCRDNDEKCKKIGQNAMAFYEKCVGRKPLLDYVQMTCRHIAKRQKDPPAFWEPPPPQEKPPNLTKPDGMCFEDHATHTSRYCNRCQEEADKEEGEKKQNDEEEKKARKNQGTRKLSLKQRMREMANKKAKTS